MRIGLVTWYKFQNFGTVLQAYALQKTVQGLGYSCTIIPNHSEKQELKSKLTIDEFGYKLRRKIKKLLKIYEYKYLAQYDDEYKLRGQLFEDFIESYLHEGPLLSLHDYEQYYNAFICGSDQIWSPAIFDPFYFFDFVKNKKKTIAYAPSIGRNNIYSHQKVDYARLIGEINYLSVREKRGAEIIKALSGRDAKIVLDPTLLLDESQWNSLIECNDEKEPYVLCYFLGEISTFYKYIKKVREKLNCKIIIVANKISDWQYKRECITVVSPQRFLSLIYHASLVLTDSFHGIAFSINFHKQFLSFLRFKEKNEKSQNSRVFNILDMFNLRSRLIQNSTELISQLNTNINFAEVNEILEEKRSESLDFLINSIEGALSNK